MTGPLAQPEHNPGEQTLSASFLLCHSWRRAMYEAIATRASVFPEGVHAPSRCEMAVSSRGVKQERRKG